MTRMIKLSVLALLVATPVLAQTPMPSKPGDEAAGKMPVINREASSLSTMPTAATDAMQSSRSPQRAGKFDIVNEPHRKYTRIEDYWQDR